MNIQIQSDVIQHNIKRITVATLDDILWYENSKKIFKGGKFHLLFDNSILSGNTLIGKIGNGLNSEYEDAERLQNSIEDILALPKAKGASWEAERVRLRKLADCCSARKLAVTTLEEAYIEALTLIRDYIGDDAYLDDGELDKYRQDLKNAKAVPAYRGTGGYIHLPNGMSYEITEPNEPEYSNAQKQIPIFEAKIKKLEGLASKLNEANQIVSDAMAEVSNSYAKKVQDIPIINLSPIELDTL